MDRSRRGADNCGVFEIRSEIMLNRAKQFLSDDCGATAIEYALIASLIAVALVVALTSLGTGLSSEFVEISGVLK